MIKICGQNLSFEHQIPEKSPKSLWTHQKYYSVIDAWERSYSRNILEMGQGRSKYRVYFGQKNILGTTGHWCLHDATIDEDDFLCFVAECLMNQQFQLFIAFSLHFILRHGGLV